MDRKKYNLLILKFLQQIINDNPDLRFCQILSILELDRDRFYEEPDKTLDNILKQLLHI